jgi:RND family efflux transporter MFP subunit
MIEEPETMPAAELRRGTSSRGKAKWLGAVALLAVLLLAGAVPRIARRQQAIDDARESPVLHPVVTVIQPAKGEPISELVLPGNMQPLYSAALYARATGYLQQRNVDIGSHVKAGQVLAVISSPEIDQQLLQAKAALGQATANAELARLTRDRNIPLGVQRAISQQTVDEAIQNYNAREADVAAANAGIAVAEANVTANRASVARLEELRSFETVVAPFDGVITERNVERGDLVNSGAGGSAKPLFSILQGSTLRVQVDVPQSEALGIRDGQKVSIQVRERLGREYTGVVVRTAGSVDSAARTMLTEVQVDNRDGSLLPGMYAQVKFRLPQAQTSFVVPTSALVIDQSGMHLVTVNSAGRIHFMPVMIGRDLGTEIEIASGLRGGERLVASPGDLLNEGQQVEVR